MSMGILDSDNPNGTARTAGILYVFPFILSFVAIMLRDGLIVQGDATATANNIMDSESTFMLSIVLDVVVQVVFIFLVFLLYWLLKPVNKNHAGLMATLFLVSVPIAIYNVVNLLAALQILGGADYLTAFTQDQLNAQALHYIDLHEQGIMIAYIFWGLWLFPLGYLVYRSGFIPRVVGIFLMISCFGYLIDFFAYFFLPDIDVAINMITGWAELVLCLWLLVKGVNVEQWRKYLPGNAPPQSTAEQ